MMQDATFQLKSLNQELGKCVEKSRPYYEALKQARHVSRNSVLSEILTSFVSLLATGAALFSTYFPLIYKYV